MRGEVEYVQKPERSGTMASSNPSVFSQAGVAFGPLSTPMQAHASQHRASTASAPSHAATAPEHVILLSLCNVFARESGKDVTDDMQRRERGDT